MSKVVRIKGVKRFRDRHGKWRCYHRKTGVALKSEYGTAAFVQEVAKLDASVQPDQNPKPGTLGGLIEEYRQSQSFLGLAYRTRSEYERYFLILRPIFDTEVRHFNPPLVVRMRDKIHNTRGWRTANYLKAVLSTVFSWGVERGYLHENPAKGVRAVKRPRNAERANRPWTDQERRTVLASAPMHLRVPIALSMYLGLRESDALALTWSRYDGRGFREIPTGKTGQLVTWPEIPIPLQRILSQIQDRASVTIAINSKGMPWTASGFRASWRTFRIGLEQQGRIAKGLTIHGLRHSVGTILREEGMPVDIIPDVLGQKTTTMARHYTREADLKKSMQDAVVILNNRTKDEQ